MLAYFETFIAHESRYTFFCPFAFPGMKWFDPKVDCTMKLKAKNSNITSSRIQI